jgi:hypothetical protein
LLAPHVSAAPPPQPIASDPQADAEALRRKNIAHYNAMVQRVAAMPENATITERAAKHRLDVLNVLWEDTGRFEGSSVGPNISDVTIEVELKNARQGKATRTALMPVLRHPSFSDKADQEGLRERGLRRLAGRTERGRSRAADRVVRHAQAEPRAELRRLPRPRRARHLRARRRERAVAQLNGP